MEQSKFGAGFDGKIQVLSPVLVEKSKFWVRNLLEK